ncbi:hydrogenase maturation peptidase HycI [Methanobrevibacter oralis]|uniref:Hydrogenase 3 maturation protease n=2 Tax=Methanobrevibacter oralis TaxID=66851 RepID=A0A162FPD5_METOA|nr:hydrogenase maturation peptidase HycI [Methanobrevibacter oralis]KZX13110.1 hydrogenase 3 maturation protease [Methanobrevibacter oralis]
MSLESQLGDFLYSYEKLIVLGVGNVLKCDDGVGPFIIKKLKDEGIETKKIMFIDAETVPENFTGKIKKEKPSHLIIVDACLMDRQPGEIKIVNKHDFANIGISTHSMSLSFFVRYLEKDGDYRIIFVGIEPESMDYADKPTCVVENAAYEFIDTLKGIL